MQIKNDSQRFKNAKPILGLLLIDVRILSDFGNVQHLAAPGCYRSHKPYKLCGVDTLRQ